MQFSYGIAQVKWEKNINVPTSDSNTKLILVFVPHFTYISLQWAILQKSIMIFSLKFGNKK